MEEGFPNLVKLGDKNIMKALEKAPDPNMAFSDLTDADHFKAIMSQEANELVNKVNEGYYYWDKVKYLKTPPGVKPEHIWAIAKFRRESSPYQLQIGGHKFFWFLNARMQELLHIFDMNIGGSLESRNVIPKDEKNSYLISSLMEEAIASSQIEGAITTRKKAKEMLRRNINPRNKSEQMIVNNYKTIQRILDIKEKNLTPDLLLEVHKYVSNDTLDLKDDEGKFRMNNDISVIDSIDNEVVYSPPDYKDVSKLIEELCYFFNNDIREPFIHPIVKGCIIHFLIGYIHPFVDGNGRTARALFYWYLLKKGYWLTEYLSISRLILRSKDQYAKAYLYTETDENDLSYFIGYKLKTMKLAFDSLREYILRKIEEKKQISGFIRLKGLNERQAIILNWFYERPALIVTVKEVETRLAIANQTARTDLYGLIERGFLEMIEMNKKTIAFIKSKNYDSNLALNEE